MFLSIEFFEGKNFCSIKIRINPIKVHIGQNLSFTVKGILNGPNGLFKK